jgi:hypothetical protein
MGGYAPVGILLVPPGASFDPVMPKCHYGHLHENITCLKIEPRMLYYNGGPSFPAEMSIAQRSQRRRAVIVVVVPRDPGVSQYPGR